MFTGAEGIKTSEQRAVYGGLANAPYDPCYHQSCDSLANVNTLVLAEMADCAAFVLVCLSGFFFGFAWTAHGFPQQNVMMQPDLNGFLFNGGNVGP